MPWLPYKCCINITLLLDILSFPFSVLYCFSAQLVIWTCVQHFCRHSTGNSGCFHSHAAQWQKKDSVTNTKHFFSSRFFPPILLEYFFFLILFSLFIFPLHIEKSASILYSCLLVLHIWCHLCWSLYVTRFRLTWNYLHLQWFFFCQIPACFRKFDHITASLTAAICLCVQEDSDFLQKIQNPNSSFYSPLLLLLSQLYFSLI